jgi:hypothetical protein
MAESGELDVAARVAARRAAFEAEVAPIEADFEAACEQRARWEADPYSSFWLMRMTGRRMLTFAELQAQRDQRLDEARRRLREDLDQIDLERRLLDGTSPPSNSDQGQRDPIPVPQLTEAARQLEVEHASLRDAGEAAEHLSTRKVEYVKTALAWGDLTWDHRHDCLGPIPRQWQSPDGVRLPKRPNRRP